MRITPRPELSAEDQAWLRKQAARAVAPRRLVERCQILLRAGLGETNQQIAAALGNTLQKPARSPARFHREGRVGLEKDAPGRGRKPTYGPEIQQLIVERTLRTKPPAATHWSQRTLAQALDLSSRTIGRVWQAHGLKPHLVRTFKVSYDPRFTEKLEDVVGLYLNQPEHALVLCCDEKSQVQALDRTQPGLPLNPLTASQALPLRFRPAHVTLYEICFVTPQSQFQS